MSRIVIVGAVSWNTMVLLDRLPEPVPHMQFASADWQTLGGTSAGKALSLTALGHDVRLRALVGADAEGRRIRGALRGAGVDPSALRPAHASERHLNLMTPAGERVSLYLASPEPADDGGGAAEDPGFADADAIVIDLSAEGLRLLPAARASGRPVWVDLHDYDGEQEFHRPFLRAADVVLCSADRLADPEAFLRMCVARGASLALCTRGADGAFAVDAAGTRHDVAAIPTEVVDTNGAGDAFFAGVLDATLQGAGLDEALAHGTRTAAGVLGTRHLHPLLDRVLCARRV